MAARSHSVSDRDTTQNMSGTSQPCRPSAQTPRTITPSRYGSFNRDPDMNRHVCVAALLGTAVLSACDKNAVQEIPTEPPLASRIKFFNFGVGAPAVNFYANETKMTAILSGTGAESNNGVAYGSAGAGGFTALPSAVYDLFARYTDSTTNKITKRSVSFFGGRVYTIDARGDITITDTTATKRPMLDNTPNR